ncbi:transposase [Bacillus thuringiensis]|uniref:transposase n=1 Tax=Bacillus thuringiensis TaxID=1428 RepID=UPI000BFCE224|nr:transposase [Bacillus thuringiensis]PGY47949.1 transposase [Bacillus thuringiensis]
MGKITQYEEEFKRQSVKHIFQTGKAVAQVARELGISVNTLHGWVKKYKQEPKVIKQRTFRSDDQQTKEMERRIQDLEEENAILKKAMHFFAKDHR